MKKIPLKTIYQYDRKLLGAKLRTRFLAIGFRYKKLARNIEKKNKIIVK